MKVFAAVGVVALALTACKPSTQESALPSAVPSSAATVNEAPTAQPSTITPVQRVNVEVPALPPPPPPPSHNYVYEQDGSYGYQGALSEDDIKSGKATKPLIMMRYLGRANGTYAVFIPENDSGSLGTRVTCAAPCQFAKTQTMSNGMVLNTETIPVPQTSIIGAMMEDAMAGQVIPFGSAPERQTIVTPSVPAAAQTSSANPPTVAPATVASQDPNPSTSQGQVQVTSFDCSAAHSIPEYLICHDPELAASDRELATLYQQAKAAAQDPDAFKERTRKQWNYREKNCRDKDCLVSWYAYQKDALTKIAQTGNINTQ